MTAQVAQCLDYGNSYSMHLQSVCDAEWPMSICSLPCIRLVMYTQLLCSTTGTIGA